MERRTGQLLGQVLLRLEYLTSLLPCVLMNLILPKEGSGCAENDPCIVQQSRKPLQTDDENEIHPWHATGTSSPLFFVKLVNKIILMIRIYLKSQTQLETATSYLEIRQRHA